MAKTKNPEQLNKKERVKATTDLRGVPEGSEGRVILSVGLDWVRYWVHWDNGIEMGSIHRDHLVRVDEWDTYLIEREEAAARAEEEALAGPAEDAAADAGGDAGGGATVNGVTVPQLLLDRTKAALERLGVSR